jgi:hypothetical protein
LADRRALDATLMDGLDPGEVWGDDGRAAAPDEGST